MCVFPPFCSSTLLAPFCSFAISYSLSCAPLFSLSFSCRLSVYENIFLLYFIIHDPFLLSLFYCWCSLFCSSSSPCFCHLPLDLHPLHLVFLKNSGFQKTHHRTQNAHLTKFRWGPETPIFIVVSGEDTERAKIPKRPFRGCTRNGAFFGPPSGRAVRWKRRNISKYTTS